MQLLRIFTNYLHLSRYKSIVKTKKWGLQPEKSGGNPASAHEKPLIRHFVEKASMKNHFHFGASKSPQTRMNTEKME